jgi:hypothetical protein
LPTIARPENQIIKLFVSAYENGSWKDAKLTFPDEMKDGGIDGLAERAAGAKLAIEHTIVEPFVGDIADQTEMIPMFPLIENDGSLLVPDVCITLFVPVGTLHLQKPRTREAITAAIHDWLRANRLSLPKGISKHPCMITGIAGKPGIEITLTLKVIDLPGHGKIYVRRQQVRDTFGDVVEKMLAKKLPKLASTEASKRILLLERQHMILDPERMLDEIQKRRASFPDLANIHEIWIVETMFYGTGFGGTSHIRFELHENGTEVRSYDFVGAELHLKYEDGIAEVVRELA